MAITVSSVEWSESKVSKILASNIERIARERGIDNWNQMAVEFAAWAKNRPFIDPIPVNTFRNIAKRANAPHASTLVKLADFLRVPVYLLFVEDAPVKPENVMALNAMIAAFVNGDKATRSAIKHMISALSAHRPRLTANR